MTYREVFTKLNRELTKLNPNELTLVTYDKSNHQLQFSQMGRVIIATYLSPFFLPKKKFKIGVLTPPGLNKLLYGLQELLKDESIDNMKYIPNLKELGTEWYRIFSNDRIPSPQVAIKLQYVNVTNRLLAKFLCYRFNPISKLLYKSLSK
jgi:hypothetical protein